MRVVAFVNNNSGPGYHRVIMPLMLMHGPDVFITNNLLEEHFEKGCDVFMYNRVLPDHALGKIAELKEKYGFKVCVDIDDYWELDEHHIMFDYYKEENFAQRQLSQIVNADIVLTTHDRLAEEIKTYNENVHVLPNAIPKQGQFDIQREPYYLVRLFWQGSATHKHDIQLLQKPLEGLGPLSPKIKMVMAGYQEQEDEWYQMALDYTANLKHQYKLIPGSHVAEYYKAYAHADICLIPLVNSRFNRHKSNLKVLEAANLGLPVIASAVHPYLDLPLLYCRNSHDWVKWITKLVDSRNRRRDTGAELKEFVDKHFNFNKINNERKQILEYEARKQTVY